MTKPWVVGKVIAGVVSRGAGVHRVGGTGMVGLINTESLGLPAVIDKDSSGYVVSQWSLGRVTRLHRRVLMW